MAAEVLYPDPIPLVPYKPVKDGYVAEGELDHLRFVMAVPRFLPVREAVLTFAYQTSIEVMPEASQIQLSLNGTPLALLPSNASQEPVKAKLRLSSQLLRPGLNLIELDVLHQHRVACTLDSTYELWTKVLAEDTSLVPVLDRAINPSSLADIGELFAISQAGDAPLAIWGPNLTLSDVVEWGSMAAQAVALQRPHDPPLVAAGVLQTRAEPDISSPLPGLDISDLTSGRLILVGTASDLAPVLSPDLARSITGPFLAARTVFRDPAQAETADATSSSAKDPAPPVRVLILSGNTPKEVSAAAAYFANSGGMLPDVPHLVVSAQGAPPSEPEDLPAIGSGSRLTLAELGQGHISTSGLRSTETLTIDLPKGYLPIDLSPIEMQMEVAHDASLDEGSQFSIWVNGEMASGFALDPAHSGGMLPRRSVLLPTHMFRPGENTLTISTALPVKQVGYPCPTPGGVPRFTVFNDSRIDIPRFATLEQLPNLHLLASQGFPYGEDGAVTDLVVPQEGGADALSTAWTFVGGVAAARGAPFPIAGRFSVDNLSQRDMIFVGVAASLPSEVIRQVSAPFGPPGQIWPYIPRAPVASPQHIAGASPSVDSVQSALDQARSLQSGPGSLGRGPVPSALGGPTPSAQPQSVDARAFWSDRNTGSFTAEVEDASGSLSALTDNMFTLLGTDHRTDTVETMPDTAQTRALVVQFQSPQATTATWTVITAPDVSNLQRGAALIGQPSHWSALDGQATLVAESGMVSVAPNRADSYIATVPPMDLENLWLLSGVLVSDFSIFWVASVLLVTILVGSLTWGIVHYSNQAKKLRRNEAPQ
ncbi:MAG: cellulose biosynthesis cyclic di-GMP-binding regulatory protein BcsB [Rhodospirillaceae bacterium]